MPDAHGAPRVAGCGGVALFVQTPSSMLVAVSLWLGSILLGCTAEIMPDEAWRLEFNDRGFRAKGSHHKTMVQGARKKMKGKGTGEKRMAV